MDVSIEEEKSIKTMYIIKSMMGHFAQNYKVRGQIKYIIHRHRSAVIDIPTEDISVYEIGFKRV